jgi:hypothetical protein
MPDPAVFLSHSHRDRAFVSVIDEVLRGRGATTFLDQSQISAGDHLSDAVTRGIVGCSAMIVFWSAAANQSTWVSAEWNFAWDRRKRVVPYVLDSTPLPDGLRDLRHIQRTDAERAHGELLRFVFGDSYVPPGEVFPGRWRITLTVGQLGSVIHDVELRPNGQIVGKGRLSDDNILAQIGGGMVRIEMRISGEWNYDETSRRLTLDMSAHVVGQPSTREQLVVSIQNPSKIIRGTDAMGRQYTIQRLGK